MGFFIFASSSAAITLLHLDFFWQSHHLRFLTSWLFLNPNCSDVHSNLHVLGVWAFLTSIVFSAKKRNVQRSPGSPLSLPDWIHKDLAQQLRSYCLQNLAPKAETFLTHSEVVWGVRDSVDFRNGGIYIYSKNYWYIDEDI
jgi:hypothetical protein